jgi:hypothetical protein
MSKSGDIMMSESGDAVTDSSRLSAPMSVWGVLEGLPRMFVPGLVILFAVLLTNDMGVRAAIV